LFTRTRAGKFAGNLNSPVKSGTSHFATENYSPLFHFRKTGGEQVLPDVRQKIQPPAVEIELTVCRDGGMLIPSNLMIMIFQLILLLSLVTLSAGADETLPLLTVKGQTYSNVTVTVVTATDVFFKHASGMGNAKLKDLDPKLQAHFHYDAARDMQMEKQQATNNILYQQFLSTNQPPPMHKNARAADGDDFVAPKLYARSVRGQSPPLFAVEKWLTPKPDVTGKFVMIFFWATSSDACRQAIPHLNAIFEKYRDRLVIIGITAEPATTVRSMTDPRIEYASGIDTQAYMARALEITAIPHCILVDPHAIVRYEGSPDYLDGPTLEHFLAKYQ
jgi:cytochrome c biogenesis protein CcmG/thiol:disulfide interchange protein DsbE